MNPTQTTHETAKPANIDIKSMVSSSSSTIKDPSRREDIDEEESTELWRRDLWGNGDRIDLLWRDCFC